MANDKCDICGDENSYRYYTKDGNRLCNKHYQQIIRHGKILKRTRFDKNSFIEKENYLIMELFDSHGIKTGETIIDKDMKEKISHIKWYKRVNKKSEYTYGKINRKTIMLHRYILFGDNDTSINPVDHIDGNGLNNLKSNLRECLHKENIRNMHKEKVIGVSFSKERNKWVAQITVDYKHIHLGRYALYEDAVNARLKAEKLYFKEFSSQN